MKINEIIIEGRLSTGFSDASPGLETWPELNNNNNPYLAYRFGLAMANNNENSFDRDGPIGGDFTTIGYTDADKEILNRAASLMGVSPTKRTNERSIETPDVNSKSPMQARGPIALKKKSK